MSNRFEIGKNRAVGVAGLSLALLLAGCSASDSAGKPEDNVGADQNSVKDFTVVKHFTPDGKMITETTIINDPFPSDRTLSLCEGGDLVEVSYLYSDGTRQRIPDYFACKDGRLDISDYQQPR